MFGLHCFQKKQKSQKPAEDIVAHESQQHPSCHGKVAVTTAPVSAKSAEARKQKKSKKVPWRNRLFSHPEIHLTKKETNWEEDVEGKESTCDTNLKAEATEHKPKSKKRSGSDAAICSSPTPEETNEQQQSTSISQAIQLLKEQFNSTKGSHVGFRDGVWGSTIDCFGFSNLGQSCYVNSSLQSLLTLEDFVCDVSRQKWVWSPVPKAQLMSFGFGWGPTRCGLVVKSVIITTPGLPTGKTKRASIKHTSCYLERPEDAESRNS
ncbi:ubiquitin carboxyl-terminal hydrolase 26-like isoform X2 [Thunnus maccoyii]|uniref:ubiquitin carboxyl-terminal hydrolase 26-like isoform X2 n=1 Tax=Thunnus maccoyii TaxID=8240 RepID=UPI001C4ABE2B|nr:ubiquitin carboxyl-terminal hydrolase 26-like isoform X2 [Thunnus maccoyii]